MPNATGKLEFSSALVFLTRSRRRGGPMRELTVKAIRKWILGRWFPKILPKHFEPIAPRIYPGVYTPRAPSTIRRKARKGVVGPMVFSGAMRRTILGTKPRTESKSSSATVKVTLAHARVVNIHKRGSRHDFPAALTAFNNRDRKSLVASVRKDLIHDVRAELRRRGPKTVRRFVA